MFVHTSKTNKTSFNNKHKHLRCMIVYFPTGTVICQNNINIEYIVLKRKHFSSRKSWVHTFEVAAWQRRKRDWRFTARSLTATQDDDHRRAAQWCNGETMTTRHSTETVFSATVNCLRPGSKDWAWEHRRKLNSFKSLLRENDDGFFVKPLLTNLVLSRFMINHRQPTNVTF